jgi:hypothetical protein
MFIPGFLISLVTFPGVIVHELAHVAFCKFTDTRVLNASPYRVSLKIYNALYSVLMPCPLSFNHARCLQSYRGYGR